MSHPREESAKWGQAASLVMNKYEQTKDEILAADAARGFHTTSGEALDALLEAGLEAKGKLTEINAKIYEEQRQRIFELVDYNLKALIREAKLEMELYRERLANQIIVEQAEFEATEMQHRASIEQLQTTVEQRQGPGNLPEGRNRGS